MDALKPEFAGRKLILQDAAAGTAFAQMYELERHFGTDYLKRLAAQKPMVVSTSAQVIDLLVRGEARVGFTVDHYRAFEPDAVKAGIRPIYPAEGMPIALAPIAIFREDTAPSTRREERRSSASRPASPPPPEPARARSVPHNNRSSRRGMDRDW
jgi:iron(III) transport system substrate-binding protein